MFFFSPAVIVGILYNFMQTTDCLSVIPRHISELNFGMKLDWD